MYNEQDMRVLRTLSNKIHTESVIWIVIAVIQILGIATAFVGIYNLIVSIQNLQYSKRILEYPVGIYRGFEPMTGTIIVLLINLFFGGVIGVIGSLYHIFGIRDYVMKNKDVFDRLEAGCLCRA